MSDDRLHIAVGVIFDRDGQSVLLARRPAGAHQGGLWEFPGGKRLPHETRLAALHRELHEELGITVIKAHPLVRIGHDYADLRVMLDVWIVDEWRGRPCGREGQLTEWVATAELTHRRFPAANNAILPLLELPPLCLITPDLPEYGEAFYQRLEALIADGVSMLQFRSKNLQGKQREEVLNRVILLCKDNGCRLILNGGDPAELPAGIQGLHLDSGSLMHYQRRPVGRELWLSAACHTKQEIEQAMKIGVDFCLLSPVRATATHPHGQVLGWEKFAVLAEYAGMPVYALGGMRPGDLITARAHGAHGVAMIRGLWPW